MHSLVVRSGPLPAGKADKMALQGQARQVSVQASQGLFSRMRHPVVAGNEPSIPDAKPGNPILESESLYPARCFENVALVSGGAAITLRLPLADLFASCYVLNGHRCSPHRCENKSGLPTPATRLL